VPGHGVCGIEHTRGGNGSSGHSALLEEVSPGFHWFGGWSKLRISETGTRLAICPISGNVMLGLILQKNYSFRRML
jgi:hypothetical protein